ncbi:MAG: alpha/beta hydrolase, partial [Methanobrevibacter sp.]|nr:alpha/beta hydrolase [Methanobrevibacter sp.]
ENKKDLKINMKKNDLNFENKKDLKINMKKNDLNFENKKDLKINMKKNDLNFEECNDEKKEAIIFLHSNLLSNWIWKFQKNSFNNHHCIFMDLPEHGKSQIANNFSIKKSAEIIKDYIEKNLKGKKIHLVGIAIGGQIILQLLAKYSELIETAIITGVNLQTPVITNINKDGNLAKLIVDMENEKVDQSLAMIKQLKIDILDKKPSDFIIKGYLAEYGLGKEYLKYLRESINSINEDNLISITEESFKFKIPEIDSSYDKNENSYLLVLYGTKEYPKVKKSAKIIGTHFNNTQIFSVYRSIHLWNIHDYEWFNEVVYEFITKKKLNLNEKPYLKKINKK